MYAQYLGGYILLHLLDPGGLLLLLLFLFFAALAKKKETLARMTIDPSLEHPRGKKGAIRKT